MFRVSSSKAAEGVRAQGLGICGDKLGAEEPIKLGSRQTTIRHYWREHAGKVNEVEVIVHPTMTFHIRTCVEFLPVLAYPAHTAYVLGSVELLPTLCSAK